MSFPGGHTAASKALALSILSAAGLEGNKLFFPDLETETQRVGLPGACRFLELELVGEGGGCVSNGSGEGSRTHPL